MEELNKCQMSLVLMLVLLLLLPFWQRPHVFTQAHIWATFPRSDTFRWVQCPSSEQRNVAVHTSSRTPLFLRPRKSSRLPPSLPHSFSFLNNPDGCLLNKSLPGELLFRNFSDGSK